MNDNKPLDLKIETLWRNLAPEILRQRVMIEATTKTLVGPEQIEGYLTQLADVSGMEVLRGPESSSAHELGFGGWIHWKTSGCHVYSYPAIGTSPPLVTIDTYTCKPFSVPEVVEFTKRYFKIGYLSAPM